MAAHALLGPSGAKKNFTCTPAARTELLYPEDPNTPNDPADEGTLAHDISDVLIKERLGQITRQKAASDFTALLAGKNGRFYNNEMLEYCQGYLNFVLEIWSKALAMDPKAVILVEQHFDLTRWIPESFGRADVVIIAGSWMWVLDFKYGQGVFVEAKENYQTRLYALGALNKLMASFPIQHIEMHIYQPRLQNFGKDYISAYDLWEWAENFVRPQALKAFAGLGDYVAGSHCKFCRAKVRCRTLSEYARTPAGSKEFADPNTLTDEEVAQIALTNPLLMSYNKDVLEFMLKKALAGKKWPLWKVGEGRSDRVVTDSMKAITLLQEKGYMDVYDVKLKTFTELERMVGKTNLQQIIGEVVIKPDGKPTMVPETDVRISYHSAASDFKIINK